jgi:hypothetical protein
MLREPIDRLVSNYYYMNSGAHASNVKKLKRFIEQGSKGSVSLDPDGLKNSTDSQLRLASKLLREAVQGNVTLDRCVQMVQHVMATQNLTTLQATVATPCSRSLGSLQWPYFCGHDPKCSLNAVLSGNRAGIDRSLTTLKTRYLLVGLMDQFNASVAALEVLVPQFFGGLSNVLQRQVCARVCVRACACVHG